MALVKGQQYTPAQIYQEDPGYLQRTNPALYSQFTQQIGQPTSTLQGSQLSNQKAATELPAVQAQSQAATTDIPLPSISTAPPVKQQDIQGIKNTYQNTWKQAGNITARSAIANDFKSATGQDLFQLYLPQSSIDSIKPNLELLNQFNYIKNGMQKDPNLVKVLGNPFWNATISSLYKLPGGQSLVQDATGLNNDGMQALAAFTKLQGVGDRQLIGGRVTGYLNGIFSPSFINTNRKPGDILNQTNNMETAINNTLNVDTKNAGFQNWSDVPGLDAYKQQLEQSNISTINNYNDLKNKRY